MPDTTAPICAHPECDKPLESGRNKSCRGFCWNHYIAWRRKNIRTTATCEQCGEEYQSERDTRKYCSNACASIIGAQARSGAAKQRRETGEIDPSVAAAVASGRWDRPCGFQDCNNPVPLGRKSKHCSDACSEAAYQAAMQSAKSSLRLAIEAGDHAEVIAEIRSRTETDTNGCWIWQGQITASRNGKGTGRYPIIGIGKSNVMVHRLVLEAKHGRLLGSQHAHHACAVTRCVNPDHLQPVTHRENIAEMLARQSYLAYIEELRQALAELHPDHPLLHRIEVA